MNGGFYPLKGFLTDYSADFLHTATASTYGAAFGGKAGETVKVRDGLYSLELWHGPTCAFKDYALQLMPKLLVEAKKMLGRTETTRILVATSGDTGKAALAGYADLDGIEIEVFYPNDGTSEIQHLQMATQKGENVQVYAVQGNFDDAQTGVKKVFADADVAAELDAKRAIKQGTELAACIESAPPATESEANTAVASVSAAPRYSSASTVRELLGHPPAQGVGQLILVGVLDHLFTEAPVRLKIHKGLASLISHECLSSRWCVSLTVFLFVSSGYGGDARRPDYRRF